MVIPGKKIEVKIQQINVPSGSQGTPLFIVFRALGIITDKEIFEMILGDLERVDIDMLNLLTPSSYENHNVLSQEDAISYLAQNLQSARYIKASLDSTDNTKLLQYTKDVINREFLAHVGQDNIKKATFLAFMVRKLLMAVLNPDLYSDRDHYSNKRVDLCGPLIMSILRYNFNTSIKEIKISFAKALASGQMEINKDIRKIIQKNKIENKIKYALSTGNWQTTQAHAKKSLESKKGIAQVLKRLSVLDTLSHIRRIQSPLEKAGSKYEPPRRYHMTQIGKICPNETPEGHQVGSVKNMALTCHVTLDCSDKPVRLFLASLGVIDITIADPKIVPYSTHILVNGDLIGIIESPEVASKIYTALKLYKLNGRISEYTSIAWLIEKNELLIQTDCGRYCRPLYIIENGNFKLNSWIKWYAEKNPDKTVNILDIVKWSDLKSGFPEYDNGLITKTSGSMIEYVDTNEEECSLIAVVPHQLIPSKIHTIIDNKCIALVSYEGSDFTYDPVNPMTSLKTRMPERWHKLLDDINVISLSNTTLLFTLPEMASTAHKSIIANINKIIYPTYSKYTHCELHAAMWHSVVSQMIPFPDRNQSPRNCYQAAMAKQAIGIYASNYTNRTDTIGNVLSYPQHPLVEPITVQYTPLAALPHGYQAVVAIMLYAGYNQEDSVIANQGSFESGMFNSVYYKTYNNLVFKSF